MPYFSWLRGITIVSIWLSSVAALPASSNSSNIDATESLQVSENATTLGTRRKFSSQTIGSFTIGGSFDDAAPAIPDGATLKDAFLELADAMITDAGPIQEGTKLSYYFGYNAPHIHITATMVDNDTAAWTFLQLACKMIANDFLTLPAQAYINKSPAVDLQIEFKGIKVLTVEVAVAATAPVMKRPLTWRGERRGGSIEIFPYQDSAIVSTISTFSALLDEVIDDYARETPPMPTESYQREKVMYKGALPFHFSFEVARTGNRPSFAISRRVVLDLLKDLKLAVNDAHLNQALFGKLQVKSNLDMLYEIAQVKFYQAVYPPSQNAQIGGCVTVQGDMMNVTSGVSTNGQACNGSDSSTGSLGQDDSVGPSNVTAVQFTSPESFRTSANTVNVS